MRKSNFLVLIVLFLIFQCTQTKEDQEMNSASVINVSNSNEEKVDEHLSSTDIDLENAKDSLVSENQEMMDGKKLESNDEVVSVSNEENSEVKNTNETKGESVVQLPNHDPFNALLQQYVDATGKVNYKGLVANITQLEEYISNLTSMGIQAHYSRNDKLAFWINLYNAVTLKLVCDNYPISSITEINEGKPWDINLVEVQGKKYSLNEIENSIIRPEFKEARIHFVLNCAAKSCPKLLNKAIYPSSMEEDMVKASEDFLSNKDKNQIFSSAARISKIFEWYKDDFEDLISFLNKYGPAQIDAKTEIVFNEYDWSLNE